MSDNIGMAALDYVAATVEAKASRENEYMDETTGLLRCTVCGGPRQTVITPPFEGAQPRTVRCWCSCPTEEDARKERERLDMIERRRRICFAGPKGPNTQLIGHTFANDDRKRPELSDAMQQYVEQFQQHLKDSAGLLLYGPTGTGKTFLAAAIANAVIDRGYTCRMTNFSDIGNALQATFEKQPYIDELCKNDLLIIDDLGIERKTEYMQEIVYNVIDARYRAGGPVIITSNLTQDELAKPGEIGYSRIYDRVLERCLAINVDGHSRRRKAAVNNWNNMRKQLGLEA